MIDHPARRIGRAQVVQTRVGAHVIDAGLVVVAVRGDDTLGSTARRTTVVAGQAGAHGLLIDRATLRVGPTRGGHARVTFHQFYLNVNVAS